MATRRLPKSVRAGVLASILLLAGCDAMRSHMDVGQPGDVITTVANDGTIDQDGVVVTRDGGQATAGLGPLGTTLVLPAFGPGKAVVSYGDRADWSPGDDPFQFGIDIDLDATALQSGPNDNGNNAIQRGLWTSDTAHQFKIQVDPHNGGLRPLCRIRGSLAAAQITLTTQLTPGDWYRLRCARDAAGVTFTLFQIATDGTVTQLETATSAVAPGTVDPVGLLTVGGKATAAGISTQSDQFNGAVDEPFLNIDRP